MRPLKLFALDEEDLGVLSAHVQDAVVKVGDIKWSPRAGQFTMPMNRFAWERSVGRRTRRQDDQRRRSVLHFDRVTRARSAGLVKGDRDVVLSLLAVVFEETNTPAGVVSIVCSGDAVLQLEVECIEAQLTDLGATWSASMRPNHRLGREKA
ncbi:DUF2948 family protein [Acuticoccus sp. 2012]|uniref:DUF2948 family protein n=1 Tax=Acuticoccus mangrovi TaxID=2796142 RepID=A0A934ISE5_9HYPH|nr:DUF2948 family protein [Acuticoccus mangrovi]